MQTQDLSLHFSNLTFEGYGFKCQIIQGEVDVLQVVVEGFEELPVYLSITDNQILCISYLWNESEVDQTKRAEMLDVMLEMNIPMPLSSFSRIQDQYVIFGALSTNSSLDDISHEIITLCENAVEAIAACLLYTSPSPRDRG